jgi:hypothetical protein
MGYGGMALDENMLALAKARFQAILSHGMHDKRALPACTIVPFLSLRKIMLRVQKKLLPEALAAWELRDHETYPEV